MSRTDDYISRAVHVLPGGVNSPVRAFKSVGADPLIISKGAGPMLIDVDGREFVDYVMSWGAVILGHNAEPIVNCLSEAVKQGTTYGMTCPAEVEIAELICELMPSIDMIRFVNSGTEATMAAVRLARGATGRDLLVKFEGCYHGHSDSFLVAAGSGVATLSLPASPGVPEKVAGLTLTLPYNDVAGLHETFRKRGDEIACVIVEPIVGNSGFIRPSQEFLPALRELTTEYDTILIFDEVMTGFRVALGGAQGKFGIRPDLTTLGKVIGGGFPVGAYGGRRDLMDMVAPSGPVYQAGTLSGNPLAMKAGLTVLRELVDGSVFKELGKRSRILTDGLAAAAESLEVPLVADHEGGMWGIHFANHPATNFEDAKRGDGQLFARFHRAAIDRGILLAPSPFEAGFISIAHSERLVADTVERLADALAVATRS
ncbi:MAG: glutamate-1-semialdehyde 2,1-aminomutase [Gemmatimonadales bacterium]